MAELTLHRYSADDAEEWDAFVRSSRNGTFLFERGYMDYHSDRFFDFSLIGRKGGRIIALLPADLKIDNESVGKVLRSHGGLTYGGWILPERHIDVADVIKLFGLLRLYAEREGIDSLDYKPMPWIYHSMPSQEDLYALFRENARLIERHISCTIDLSSNPGFNLQQRRNLKRAVANDTVILEVDDVSEFHVLLSKCLAERHGVAPVHSVEELQLLHDRFPRQIRIFLLKMADMPQAGVCVYDTGRVAHAQYICTTPIARKKGLLTLLFKHLFDVYRHCTYFDFGISTESGGSVLNEGLYRQKSSLGGSGVVYDRYRIVYNCR